MLPRNCQVPPAQYSGARLLGFAWFCNFVFGFVWSDLTLPGLISHPAWLSISRAKCWYIHDNLTIDMLGRQVAVLGFSLEKDTLKEKTNVYRGTCPGPS